jgi:hypothetical protein
MPEPPKWRTDVTVVVVHPSQAVAWAQDGADPTLRFQLDGYHWFPDVEPILHEVRARWHLDAIVLRCLDFRVDEDKRQVRLTYLLQQRADAQLESRRWIDIGNLDLSDLANDQTRPVIEAALHELCMPAPPARRAWTERGWFEDAVAWSDAALRNHDLEPRGLPQQLRTWGLSTVIRFDPPCGNLYFKAAAFSGTGNPSEPEPNRSFLFANEAALLTGLANHVPDHLPVPLAVDPERVWMLLPDAGAFLADCHDLAAWEHALRLHARHQRAYVERDADLFAIGCLDRRLSRLSVQFDELLADDAILSFLDPPDRDRLRAAAPTLRAQIAELASLGIPDTLVHGDLHAFNVCLRDGYPIYFDWTDACVAHPFLDLVTFTGESDFLDKTSGARERLHAAYLDEWRDLIPDNALHRAADLIFPIGALHQVVSYQHMLGSLDEPDRSSMGRGGAFWLCQVLNLRS